MNELLVVRSGESVRLDAVLAGALAGVPHAEALADGALPPLAGRRVLFALALDELGPDERVAALLRRLRAGAGEMEGSVCGMLIDGAGELFTKRLARTLALAANTAGCLLPGKPLVEATGTLANWRVRARQRGVSPFAAYQLAARELALRLADFAPAKAARPKVLLLHASDQATSNTLQIGSAVCDLLRPDCDVTEIALQNGEVHDCRGCSHRTCAHYAAQNACFYGGSVTRDVYPAIMACDALLLLCPNYNDSVGANVAACINRLTGLLVYNDLYDKYLYAVVVSGYSGGDLVAEQALGALCLNKTFMLPPRFCLMQTANDPGEAMRAPGIEERIRAFAEGMLHTVGAQRI